MKRRDSWSWAARLRAAVLAALPALACVSGAAEPFEGNGTAGNASAGAATAGSTTTLYAGSNATAGTATVGSAGRGGNASAGSGNPQAGSSNSASSGGSSVGGSSSNPGGGGAGGTKPAETCAFPNWAAGHDYAKGDKVLYMGKAFVASEANPGYDPLISTYFWAPYSCDPGVGAGGSSGGGSATGGSGGTGMLINNGDCVLGKLLPAGESSYHAMFVPPWQGHQEQALYNYAALCTALKGFGQFANSGNAEADKRELAAFFAHVAKETAFLEQTDEAGQASGAGDFHGRGAIQLTGQANYQAAGDYLNKNLVGNPGMVSTDAVTNWQTALWFWVVHNNPGAAGTKNCHQAIQAGDFAQTTRIINGGIECPGTDSAKTRAEYFKSNCGVLGVSPGSSLVC